MSVPVKPETKTTRTNEWINKGATTILLGNFLWCSTMDEKWWIKSIHYRWSMDDDNDLNHLRSDDDLDIQSCIPFCGWNVIILKWISSMDSKLDDIRTTKNCMNYHVKYTIFVIKNYESFIDVLDYVRIDRCHLWSVQLLIIASSFSSKELRLYSNRLLPICLD